MLKASVTSDLVARTFIMNIIDAVNCMCDLAKGEAEQFDVIASNSHSEGLSVFQGQVQNTEISDSVGLGIRVIKDGRPGYAHTERLTKEAIAQTIKDAICHTQWTEKVDFELPVSYRTAVPRLQERALRTAPHYLPQRALSSSA